MTKEVKGEDRTRGDLAADRSMALASCESGMLLETMTCWRLGDVLAMPVI